MTINTDTTLVDRFRQLRATHDDVLRNALIEEHMPLVRRIAGRYHVPFGSGWERSDLEQEAALGLLRAVDRYEPDGRHQGVAFASVAEWSIRRALHDAIADAIAEQPTMPMSVLLSAEGSDSFDASITPAWLQDRVTRELPTVGPSVEEQVVASVDGAQVSSTLEAALVLLSERQRLILTRRYALPPEQHVWTLRAIGDALGVHKSTVYRQQQKALTALRAHLSQSHDGVLILRRMNEQQRSAKRRAA